MTDEMGLTLETAREYEQFFVPAIFSQWPAVVIDVAEIKEGEAVLEVGCGTGVFTREAIIRVGVSGSVTGLDLSESMLTVARETSPGVQFYQGSVIDLPFDDASFDVVTSSFMLMFVPDPEKALSEMLRVLRPGGRLAICVWEALTESPVYSGLVTFATNRIDSTAGESLGWPFALGEEEKLRAIFRAAGAPSVKLSHQSGRAQFPSVEDFVRTEIEAWLLADSVKDAQIDAIIEDTRAEFALYCDDAGGIDFPMNAIFAVVKI